MRFKSHKAQAVLLSMSLPKSKEDTKKKPEAEVIDVDNIDAIMKPPATKKSKNQDLIIRTHQETLRSTNHKTYTLQVWSPWRTNF